MDTEIFLPPDLEVRIRKLNHEYLTLAQDLARLYPAAPALLGAPQEIVDILETTPLSRFTPLIETDMLIAQIRLSDVETWRRAAKGNLDTHQLLHAMLRTVPMELE